MNFFRDKELAERFSADKVSEREIFCYFLLTLLLIEFATSTYLGKLFNEQVSDWDIYVDLIAIISTIVGTLGLYYLNSRGDGKNFVPRYISLSFPVFIKSMLVLLILSFALGIIDFVREDIYNLKVMSDDQLSLSFFCILLVVLIYFYLRLAYSMKIASRPSR